MPLFSIIIPFRAPDAYLDECLSGIGKQTFKDFEVILLPDGKINGYGKGKFRVYETGPVKPSAKRNMGVRKSKGRYVAFIDSDAYPKEDWLACSLQKVRRNGIGIVGGPNLMPPNDGMMQMAGNDVLSSPLGTGGFSKRYTKKDAESEAVELPSCNIIMTKNLFERIGGFDESLLTGEDSKLCFQARNLGLSVLYSPDIIVYHHRRPLFRPHLRQIWRYGKDKASVIHMVPKKDRLLYFMPSAFVIAAAAGAFLSFNPFSPQPARAAYVLLALIYMIACGAASLRGGFRFPLVFAGIMLTHVAYGLAFLQGLSKKAKVNTPSLKSH